jgi:hypothetical protein
MTENKMTFLEQLQSHKGRLLCLKTDLFWYGGMGLDKNPGQIFLILGADSAFARRAAAGTANDFKSGTIAILLIDSQPRWVLVAEEDVEVIYETR